RPLAGGGRAVRAAAAPPAGPGRPLGPGGAPARPPGVAAGPGSALGFGPRGRELDLGYGGLVSTVVAVLLLCLAALVLLPSRVRVAVDRLEAPRGMLRAYAAGAVAALLVAAVTLLFRYTFLLIGIAPVLWPAVALAIIFR